MRRNVNPSTIKTAEHLMIGFETFKYKINMNINYGGKKQNLTSNYRSQTLETGLVQTFSINILTYTKQTTSMMMIQANH